MRAGNWSFTSPAPPAGGHAVPVDVGAPVDGAAVVPAGSRAPVVVDRPASSPPPFPLQAASNETASAATTTRARPGRTGASDLGGDPTQHSVSPGDAPIEGPSALIAPGGPRDVGRRVRHIERGPRRIGHHQAMTDALPPAHWAADPSGRHEHRYWDGARWTDHVADGGAQTVDPLGDDGELDGTLAGDATPPEQAALPSTGDTGAVVVPPPPPPPPPPSGTGMPGGPGRFAGAWTPWRELDGLRTALVALFVAGGVAAVALLGTSLNRIAAIDDYERGTGSLASLRDADDAVGAAAGLQGLVLIATIVVFIIWQFRCAKNLEVLGREGARLGPGWSIGGWFIPLANLVIPVLIFQGFWRATAPGTREGRAWTDGRGSALIGWWWGVFLVSNISGFSFGEDRTRDEIRTADTSAAVGSALRVVAVVLAIMVVVRLTRRFDERRAESPELVGA
jgi:hypothetical protein